MKKMFAAAAICGLSIAYFNAGAQTSKCAFDDILRSKLAADPSFQSVHHQLTEDINRQVAQYEQQLANTAQKTTTSTYAVPVVFHVVLSQSQINQLGGVGGIHERVGRQIQVLNTDFNARNADSTKMHAPFKPLFGNANISFHLAHRTPANKTTSGVEIKVAPVGFMGFEPMDGSVKNSSLDGLDPWDNQKYLNIWITNLIDGSGNTSNVLGYGYSPNYAQALGVPNETGVVISYGALGTKKSVNEFFISSGATLGRTLVHELGHFFNLWHIWGFSQVGSGTCNDDDDVSDTPKQSDANQSCVFPTIKANCGNSAGGEMYMNYMDYPGDHCTVMFTKAQATRMQAQLAPGGKSHGLTQNPQLFDYPTGVDDIEVRSNISISPNPSTGIFNVALANFETLGGIEVYNMMGQLVKQVGATGSGIYNIDLSGMPKGLYIVHCRFEEGTVTRKVVLQ